MNVSDFVDSEEAVMAICDLVDNRCALNRSEQPAIVISAYCAVFLPWGMLALLDMINERWKPIWKVFAQSVFQIVIAFPTIGYTIYYIELQRIDRDYKEMCAAIVAVCLSAIHFFRTGWGLWQAYWYWKWVKDCLWHLHQHGYDLKDVDDSTSHQRYKSRTKQLLGIIRQTIQNGRNIMCKLFHSIRRVFSSSSDSSSSRTRSLTQDHTKKLLELSLEMKLNSSVVDNEFFECDIPFDVNFSRLRSPRKWFSSTEPLFVPRYTQDAWMRYMIPFLAQYGRRWLQDSAKARKIVKIDIFEDSNVFATGHFVSSASMLTQHPPLEAFEDHTKYNWSNTWLSVLIFDREQRRFKFDCGVGMPFGFNENKMFFELPMFIRFRSKIRSLVDSLPDELFETRIAGEMEIIQQLCGEDLENFMLFLNSDRLDSVDPLMPLLDPIFSAMTSSNGSQRQRPGATHLIDVWGLVNEKFPEFWGRDGRNDWFQTRLNCTPSRKVQYQSRLPERAWEFTIHLENLFAIYSGNRKISFRETPDDEDRNQYYKEFCRRSRPHRKVLATENVRPLCTFETYYWNLWDLPRCTPPALVDIDVQDTIKSRCGGVKFIGYIMETVRHALAKWTKQGVAQNFDTNIWSPEVEIRSAQVEFDASGELGRQLMNHRRLDREHRKFISPNAIHFARVQWECQKHLMEAVRDNVYGPSDVELMLLFILGFPALQVEGGGDLARKLVETGAFFARVPTNSADATEFEEFFAFLPHRRQRSFMALISFRDCESSLKIRMQLIPVEESREIHRNKHRFTFSWAEWIHGFEACMKVLAYDYGDGELCGAPSRTYVDIMGGGMRVEEQVVECACKRNRYRLNQRAKRVFMAGTQKYFWEWEGWKAQESFEGERYPILSGESSSDSDNDSGNDDGGENGNTNGNTNGGDVAQHRTNSLGETRIPMPPEHGGADASVDDVRRSGAS
ncbi:Rhs element Vgr family protein [Gracilaria domingensis]|nr:Rhs element Vgr family protein [Gracilaria domingensis]